MELFDRIRFLAKNSKYSLASIATHLGVTPQAFNKWLKAGSQKNLWEHLPKILELFPEVRPEWLYMGQEPAFYDGTQAEPSPTIADVEILKARLAKVEAELDEERALNRKLTAKMLIDGVGDKDVATSIGKASEGHE